MRCGRVVYHQHPATPEATKAKEMGKGLIKYTAYPRILPKWKWTCQQQLYRGEHWFVWLYRVAHFTPLWMSVVFNYQAAPTWPHHHSRSWRGGRTRLKEERKPRKSDRPREESKKFNKITPTPLFLTERLHTGFSTPVDNPITIWKTTHIFDNDLS